MTVRVGTQAPGIEVDAYVRGELGAKTLSLSDLRGRWVVLFFYPRDFTFVCPTELSSFATLQREFELEDTVIIGASTDSFHCHKAWFESDLRLQEVMYPIIADTSHRLSEAFEVLLDDGSALRGTFIIDPDGVIRHVSVIDLSVGRGVEETLRVLQALRTGELCPAGWRPGQPTLTAVEPALVS